MKLKIHTKVKIISVVSVHTPFVQISISYNIDESSKIK